MFWNTLKNWLQLNGNINLSMTDKNIIFAWPHESSLISYLIIIAKYYIYKTKFLSKHLSIQGFQSLLKRKFKNEQYIARINKIIIIINFWENGLPWSTRLTQCEK